MPTSREWDEMFEAAKNKAAPLARQIRQREAAVATRTEPLAVAEAKGITPRDWIAATRAESEALLPIMIP